MMAAPAPAGGAASPRRAAGGGGGGGAIEALVASVGEGAPAVAVEELLGRLDERRDALLAALAGAAAARFAAPPPPPADAPALAADAAARDALAALAERDLAGGDAACAAAAAAAGAHAAAERDLAAAAGAAAAARAGADLAAGLAAFDAAAARADYAGAAEAAVQLEAVVASAPALGAPAAAAVAARASPLRARVAAAPGRLLTAAAAGGFAPAPAGPRAATELADVWRAAAALGVLPATLAALADFLLERSVAPILAAAAAATRAPGAPADGGAIAERLLYKALKAAAEGALGGRAELAAGLGEALWPRLARAYVAARLEPLAGGGLLDLRGGGAAAETAEQPPAAAPEADLDLGALARRGALGAKLEEKAAKLGLLPAAAGPIAAAAAAGAARAARARRAALAAAARDLLASAAAHETEVVAAPAWAPPGGVAEAADARALFEAAGAAGAEAELAGEASLLNPGPYAVSRAVAEIARRMRSALVAAAAAGSAAAAAAAAAAALDAAALVVALPPRSPGAAGAGDSAELEALQREQGDPLLLPYPAALRYNDCMHVYRTLCALPYCLSPALARLLPGAGFAAAAARARAAGLAALEGMVGAQRRELLALAAELAPPAGGLDAGALIRARRAGMQLAAAFRRLGAVLRPALPPPALAAVAGALLDAAAAQACAALLARRDISVEESEQLPGLLEGLARGGLRDAALLGAPGGAPGGALAAALDAAAPSAARLAAVLSVLEARLAEIAARWADGSLAAAGLSARDVGRLVGALFEETEPRAELLSRLEADEESEYEDA